VPANIHDFFSGRKKFSGLGREELCIIGYNYNNEKFDTALFVDAGIVMPEQIIKSAPVRQAEFFAGRFVAKEAFAFFGVEASNIAVGEHRQPQWPSAFSASISHTKTAAVCVVAQNAAVDYLGIDIENCITSETANNIKQSIINEDEERLLLAHGYSLERGLTLVFSAKESVFKAAYKFVGRYFDFSAARLLEISQAQRRLRLVIEEDLSAQVHQGMVFELSFDWQDDNHDHRADPGGSVTTLLAGRF